MDICCCVCVSCPLPLNGKETLSGKTLLPPVAEGARQCARRTLACTIRKIQGAVEEQEAPTGGRAGEVRHRAGEGGLDGKGVVAAARDPDGAGEHAFEERSAQPVKLVLITLEERKLLGELASEHGLTVDEINHYNGWSYPADIRFEVGSTARVVCPLSRPPSS